MPSYMVSLYAVSTGSQGSQGSPGSQGAHLEHLIMAADSPREADRLARAVLHRSPAHASCRVELSRASELPLALSGAEERSPWGLPQAMDARGGALTPQQEE